MFNPEQLKPLPDFNWQSATETPALKDYRHFYRLDRVTALPDVYHCFGNIKAGNFTLLAQAFIHPNNQKNVFLLHGYTDHLGLFDQIIFYLVSHGFNVVGLDLPGHGLSESGERTAIHGFEQYQQAIIPLIDMATKQLSGSWALIGQSTGGAIAMDYVLNNANNPFSQLVLLAPLVVPRHWTWARVQFFTLRPFLRLFPRKFRDNSGDKRFLQFLEFKDPLQEKKLATVWVQSLYDWQQHFLTSPCTTLPTLVIQGDKDVVVGWEYNLRKIREKFLRLTELIIPNAKHHLVNETAAIRHIMFERIKLFLTEP